MKFKLKDWNFENGYISAIDISLLQCLINYPFQVFMAFFNFIITIIPIFRLKSLIIDIHYMHPRKELLEKKIKIIYKK